MAVMNLTVEKNFEFFLQSLLVKKFKFFHSNFSQFLWSKNKKIFITTWPHSVTQKAEDSHSAIIFSVSKRKIQWMSKFVELKNFNSVCRSTNISKINNGSDGPKIISSNFNAINLNLHILLSNRQEIPEYTAAI